MCYRPLYIKNPKIDPNIYADPSAMYVPCGCCQECQHGKHMEWLTRSYYEYLDTMNKGGQCYYFTLTYNNYCLPVYNGMPCFSKRDIQLFLKRLRKKLGDIHCKYFISSEFGGKTHRPHYHGLFYLDKSISPHSFGKFLNDAWSFGFTKSGMNYGLVDGFSAIVYVSKYVEKDIDFDYNLPKMCRPFHLQSRGFGEYIIQKHELYLLDDKNTINKLVQGTVLMPCKQGWKEVFIPMYVTRKLMFDLTYVEENGERKPRWVINDVGRLVKYRRYDIDVKKAAEKFENLYNNINSIIYDKRRMEVFNRNACTNFTTTAEIRSCFGEFNPKEVAEYCALYKSLVYVAPSLEGSALPPFMLFSPEIIQYQLDVKYGSRPPEPELSKYISCACAEISPIIECQINLLNALRYVQGYFKQLADDREKELYSQLKILCP